MCSAFCQKAQISHDTRKLNYFAKHIKNLAGNLERMKGSKFQKISCSTSSNLEKSEIGVNILKNLYAEYIKLCQTGKKKKANQIYLKFLYPKECNRILNFLTKPPIHIVLVF